MAFKTAAEIFGDGGGWGTQVNISLVAPSGAYAATNRGIGFGEVLSSAIANRTTYALGLNADDLNTRLALWETGGLDTAYDLGAAAVPGGGREITKNAGAVETVSTLATQYIDDLANAHFRANALGDSTSGGGFDFRGLATASPAYGFLSRVNKAITGGFTLAATGAVTLNPGGLGGAIIRFGAAVHNTTTTDVSLDGLDFIELTGSAHDGLYRIISLGAATTDLHVVQLNNVAPSFGVSAAATAKPFIAHVVTSAMSGTVKSALALSAFSDANALLTLYGHDTEGLNSVGPEDALRFYFRLVDGINAYNTRFTTTGRLKTTLTSDSLAATAARLIERAEGGIPSINIDKSEGVGGYHELGVLVTETDGNATSWAALESRELTTYPSDGIDASINGTFTTPEGRVILPDSDGTPAPPTGQTKTDWVDRVQPGVTLVKILTASNPVYVGRHYLLSEVNLTAAGATPDEMTLTNLDGSALGVGDIPTSTNFTFKFIQRTVVGGKLPPITVDTGPDSSGITVPTDLTPATVLCAPQTTTGDTTGLAAAVFRGAIFGVRADDAPAASTDVHSDLPWMLQENGDFSTYGKVRARGDVSAGYGAVSSAGFVIRTTSLNAEFKYATARTRIILIGIGEAYPNVTDDWELNIGNPGATSRLWRAKTNSGRLNVDLNPYLRDGMDITEIKAIVKPGAARATGDCMSMRLIHIVPDWTTVNNNPVDQTSVAVDEDDFTANKQYLTISPAHTVVREGSSAREYYLNFKAGNTAAADNDFVYAIRLTVSDYGPRNF